MNGPARDEDGRGRERKVYRMLLRNKDGREITLNINWDDLALFETSPDVGDPDCICSYCGFVIQEDEVPIRFGHTCNLPDCDCKDKEARLHQACFRLLAK